MSVRLFASDIGQHPLRATPSEKQIGPTAEWSFRCSDAGLLISLNAGQDAPRAVTVR